MFICLPLAQAAINTPDLVGLLHIRWVVLEPKG